jgi:phage-related protein
MMDLLRRKAAMMGKTLNSKELAAYAASTAGLAAVYMETGQSSEQARASAMMMSEQLIKSKENFKSMFAGTTSDLDDFQKNIGIGFGDIGVSMKAMNQGPGEFVTGMAAMVAHARKMGKDVGPSLDLMRGRLEAAVGPEEAARLVNFFKTGKVEAIAMMKDVMKSPAQLGKLGKQAHRTGRTLAESFELAKDSFISSFRAISRKEAVDFVRGTGKEFKRFNKNLKELASDGGPMGELVKKFAEMHQIGALSLIPKTLRPMAAVFGEILGELGPMVGILGSLGFRFSMLANPIVMVTAAAGAMFALFKANEGSIKNTAAAYDKQSESIKKLQKSQGRHRKGSRRWLNLQEKIDALNKKRDKLKPDLKLSRTFQKQTKTLAALNKARSKALYKGKKWTQLTADMKKVELGLQATREDIAKRAKQKAIVQIQEGVKKAVQKIGLVGEVLLKQLQTWLPVIKDFMFSFWDGLINGVDPGKGGKKGAAMWGAKLGDALRSGLVIAVTAVKTYIKKWWSKMVGIWSDDSKSFTDKIKETIGGSAGLIIGAFAVGKFTPVFGVLKLFGGSLMTVAKSVGTLAKAMNGFIPTPFLIIGGLFALAQVMDKYPEKVDAVFNNIGKYFSQLTVFLVKGGVLMVKALGRVLWELPGIFYQAFMAAVKAAFGILDGIKQELQQKFPKWFGVIETAFIGLKVIAVGVITAITVKWLWMAGQWVASTYAASVKYIATQKAAALASISNAKKAALAWVAGSKMKLVAAYEWITIMPALYAQAAWASIKNAAKSAKAWVVGAYQSLAAWVATKTTMIAGWLLAAKAAIVQAAIASKAWIKSAYKALAAWVATYGPMVAGAIATAAGMVAAMIPAALAMAAAAIPVIVAWLPFIALGVAIGAAIAGVVYVIHKYWDPIAGFFKKVFSAIWEAAKWGFKIMKYWILMPYYAAKAVWWGLTKFFGMLWDGIKAAAKWVWEAIGGVVMWPVDNIIKPAWNAIAGFFTGLWDGIKSVAKKAWDAVGYVVMLPVRAVKAVWGAIKGFFKGLWNGIKKVAAKVWDGITYIFRKAADIAKKVWGGVKGFFGGVWNGIKGAASKAWSGIKSVGKSLFGWMGSSSKKSMAQIAAEAEAARKKIESQQAKIKAAALGMSKEVTAKITSNADIAKVQAMKVGDTFKGMIKTSKGEIIHATDSVIKYVRGAHGEVVKTVHAANQLNYGKITGVEEMTKAIPLFEKHKAILDKLRKSGKNIHSKEWKKEMERYKEATKEFRAEYGRSASELGGLGSSIQKALGSSKDRIQKLRETDHHAAIRFNKQREGLLNELAKKATWIENNRVNMSRAQYKKEYEDLRGMAASYNMSLEKQIDIGTGNWDAHWNKVQFKAKESEAFLALVAASTSSTWRAAQDDIVASLTAKDQKIGESAKTTLDNLKMAMDAKIKAIENSSTLSADQIKAQVKAIETEYGDVAAGIRAKMVSEVDNLNNGITSGMSGYLKKVESDYSMAIDAGKAKSQEMQGEIQKMGFTAEDSKNMLTEIANLDTKTFKNNLAVVKEEFLGLLSKLGEIQKGLIDLGPTSTDAFKEAQKALSTFWADFDKRFSGSKNIADIAKDVFKKVTDHAKTMRKDLKDIFVGLFSDIAQFAVAIFKKIRIETKTAVENLKATAGAAYEVSTQSAGDRRRLDERKGLTIKKSFKKDTVEEGQRQLYEAVHWPEWYTRDFAQLAMSMKESLRSMDMKMSADGGTGETTMSTRDQKLWSGMIK